MTAPIHKPALPLAVVGAGRLSAPLRDHEAPFGRIRIVGADGPSVRAVLIDLPVAERHAAAVAALRAGRLVLCPPPVARTAEELAALAEAARLGGGRLLPAGEIAHCDAARHGLAAVAAEGFGAVKSIYLAIRQPRGQGGDVLDEVLPEAVDMLLSLLPGPFTTVRVNAGALFGPVRDTAVILLRDERDVVVTMELSRCLPTSLPAPGLGEVEIDVMGAAQSVRIVPQNGAVRVHGDGGSRLAEWLDAPVLAMLRTALAAADGQVADGLARAEAALTLQAAIRAAA